MTGDEFTQALESAYRANVGGCEVVEPFPTESDRLLVVITEHLGELDEDHRRAELLRLVAIAKGRVRYGSTENDSIDDLESVMAYLRSELQAKRAKR